MTPFTDRSATCVSWVKRPGDTYVVTGTARNGKRFAMTTDNWLHAASINVWQGNKWLLRDGKRYLIQRVIN